MATEAELKALAQELDFIKGNPEYYNRRAQCMSGFKAKSLRERRESGMTVPDVGTVCLELLKHSADVEADPKAKAARQDQELLGPYKAISADKGFKPTDANALKLLGMYDQIANLPNVAQLTQAASFPVGLGNGKTSDFYITQGSALDTAFTKAVLDAYAGKPAPAVTARKSAEELVKLTDACFRNQGVTIGECTETGKEQASLYLNSRPKRAATR